MTRQYDLKINLPILTLSVLIPFSGIYLTRLMPISPVYFAFVISFVFFLLYLLLNIKSVRILNKSIYPAFIWFSYLLVSQLFLSPDVHTVISALMSVLYFILTIVLITKLDVNHVIKIVDYMFWISIPLLLIESYYRITHPVFTVLALDGTQVDVGDTGIYPFKFNSIMYQDSNFVGIYIVCLFFLAYYLYNYISKRKFYLVIMGILFVLTLLTLARGAISGLIIFFPLFVLSRKIGLGKTIFIFFWIAVLFDIFFLQNVEQDGSIQARFMIIERTISFIKSAPIYELIFGVGIGNSLKYLDIGSHNFFVTYIVETGFLGLTIMMSFWLYLAYISKGNVLFVMLPFLFAGMSLAGHAVPFLYTAFAIIIKLSTEKTIQYDKV